MSAGYQFRTYFGIGLGLAAELTADLMVANQHHPSPALVSAGLAMGFGGAVPLIYGCRGYMKGKGYDVAWSWLGLLSVAGVAALASFPDRHKAGVRPAAGGLPVEP